MFRNIYYLYITSYSIKILYIYILSQILRVNLNSDFQKQKPHSNSFILLHFGRYILRILFKRKKKVRLVCRRPPHWSTVSILNGFVWSDNWDRFQENELWPLTFHWALHLAARRWREEQMWGSSALQSNTRTRKTTTWVKSQNGAGDRDPAVQSHECGAKEAIF